MTRKKRKSINRAAIGLILLASASQTILSTSAESAFSSSSSPAQIRWSLPEESRIGAYVGSLKGQGSDLVHTLIDAQIYRNNRILKKKSHSKLIAKAKHLFEIESGNKLLTKGRIDREEICGGQMNDFVSQCGVILEIVTSNSNGGYEIQEIYIDITGINDNKPVFRSPICKVKVKENSPINQKISINHCQANDPDGDHIKYTIESNPVFALKKFQSESSSRNPEIALNSLRKLDYEADQKTLEFNLYASDGKFSSKSSILIEIQDENDNSPIFEKSEYFERVSENLPVGRTVLTCSASDFDRKDDLKYALELKNDNNGQENENGRNFTIDNFPFAIDEKTGEIRVISGLDYDQDVSRYTFEVRVSDGENEAFVPVTLEIQNENDNLPQISVSPVKNELTTQKHKNGSKNSEKFSVIEVFENSGENGLLATVRVWDDDLENSDGQGDIVTRLLPANAPFRLRQLRGFHYALETTRTLDFEKENSYDLEIEACEKYSDTVSSPATASTRPVINSSKTNCVKYQLRVLIHDRNDNVPQCSSENYFSIPENSVQGTLVGKLGFNDPDSQKFGHKFSITSEISEFTIDEATGEIYVSNAQLDYETVKSHQFTIEVLDLNSSNLKSLDLKSSDSKKILHRVECAVKIDILDENDNSPIFVHHFGKLIVPKKLDQNCPGIYLEATDSDTGANSRIEYRQITNSDVFWMNTRTGELKISDHSKLLEKLGKSPNFQILQSIQAKDHGRPRKMSQLDLNVELEDTLGCLRFVSMDDPNSSALESLEKLELASVMIGALVVVLVLMVVGGLMFVNRRNNHHNNSENTRKNNHGYMEGALRSERYSGSLLYKFFGNNMGSGGNNQNHHADSGNLSSSCGESHSSATVSSSVSQREHNCSSNISNNKSAAGQIPSNSDYYSVRSGQIITSNDQRRTRRGEYITTSPSKFPGKYDLNINGSNNTSSRNGSSVVSQTDHIITVTDKSLAGKSSTNDVVIMFDTTLAQNVGKHAKSSGDEYSVPLTEMSREISRDMNSDKFTISDKFTSSDKSSPTSSCEFLYPGQVINATLVQETLAKQGVNTSLRSQHNSGPSISPNSNKEGGTIYSRARTVQLSTSQRDLTKPNFSTNQNTFTQTQAINKNSTSDSGMERNSHSHEVSSEENLILTDSSSNNRTPSSDDNNIVGVPHEGPNCDKSCMVYGHSDVCWTKTDSKKGVLGHQNSVQSNASSSSRESKRHQVLRPARKSGLVSSL